MSKPRKLLFSLFFVINFSFGMKKDSIIFKRIDCGIDAFISKSTIGWHRYIEPTYSKCDPASCPNHTYDAFYRYPQFNWQIGGWLQFAINRSIIFQTGIALHCRNYKFESDSVHVALNILNQKTIEYLENSYDIDIPLFIGYRYHSFELEFGAKTVFFTKFVRKSKDIDGFKKTEIRAIDFNLKYGIFVNMCPNIRVKYFFNREKKTHAIFFATEMRDRKYLDFQLGYSYKFR